MQLKLIYIYIYIVSYTVQSLGRGSRELACAICITRFAQGIVVLKWKIHHYGEFLIVYVSISTVFWASYGFQCWWQTHKSLPCWWHAYVCCPTSLLKIICIPLPNPWQRNGENNDNWLEGIPYFQTSSNIPSSCSKFRVTPRLRNSK